MIKNWGIVLSSTTVQWWAESVPSWNRVKVHENLDLTAVAPVDRSLILSGVRLWMEDGPNFCSLLRISEL